MSETPKHDFHPETLPPTSTLAEESPASIHNYSPGLWKLFPRVEDDLCPGICFEIRAGAEVVAYIAYDCDLGITDRELADARLILAAPRLLELLLDFSAAAHSTTGSLAPPFQALDRLLEELKESGVLR